jgi:hypothetical protein
MKNKTITALFAVWVLSAIESSAFPVYIPPNNIVLNGSFQSGAGWGGGAGYVLGVTNTPNENCAITSDIYQVLPTIPGQQYLLTFYAAADLLTGPSVNFEVALNSTPLVSYTTPPYTYNPQINRYVQLHWAEYTDTFVASSSSTRLEFIDLNSNDFALAAISVIPVPEPASLTLLTLAGVIAVISRKRLQRRQIAPFVD